MDIYPLMITNFTFLITGFYLVHNLRTPPVCSAPDCAGKGSAPAIMMCLDHSICMQHHPDRPPPAFYCRDCFLTMQRLNERLDDNLFRVSERCTG